MRLKIRVDSWHGDHVRFTVFMQGASCGQLCARVGEYQLFTTAVLMGAEKIPDLYAEHDDREFSKIAEKRAKEEEENDD